MPPVRLSRSWSLRGELRPDEGASCVLYVIWAPSRPARKLSRSSSKVSRGGEFGFYQSPPPGAQIPGCRPRLPTQRLVRRSMPLCSYAGVATAEGAAPLAPAGRRGLLLCLAAVSALTFAVSSTRPSSTATAPLPRPSTTAALAVAATTPPPPPPAAAAAGAGARAPRVVCLAANRTFAVGAMIDVPPLASSCRPCTCTPRGEWQCCTVRPAAHSIARGTERYAETLAFVAAWSHLKQESQP